MEAVRVEERVVEVDDLLQVMDHVDEDAPNVTIDEPEINHSQNRKNWSPRNSR
jgi:hypothetical protein